MVPRFSMTKNQNIGFPVDSRTGIGSNQVEFHWILHENDLNFNVIMTLMTEVLISRLNFGSRIGISSNLNELKWVNWRKHSNSMVLRFVMSKISIYMLNIVSWIGIDLNQVEWLVEIGNYRIYLYFYQS